jgi:diguanylate cyclase (GGDEF)-like protein
MSEGPPRSSSFAFGVTAQLATQLADLVAIDNACVALVVLYPGCPERIDVHLPEFVQSRGFQLPAAGAEADRFWTSVAAPLHDAHEDTVAVQTEWRGDRIALRADRLGADRWVVSWIRRAADVASLNMPQPEVLNRLVRDSLTGLLNRRAFLNIIDGDAVSGSPFDTVLFLDVQRFKSINDTWGHLVGDECLIQVARLLSPAADGRDVVARPAVDEFVLLCVPHSPLPRLVMDWGVQRVMADGHQVPVSLRAGVAHRAPGQTLQDLVRQADQALTAAKADPSRSVITWNPDIGVQATAQMHEEQSLRSAFDTNDIAAYFQPMVNLDVRRVSGFEALVRVTGEHAGLQPSTVLHTARRLGLSAVLAGRVALAAFSDGRPLIAAYPGAVINVNLSREYFASGIAVDATIEAAQRAGIPAASVVLELTEEFADGVPAEVLREQVLRCQQAGVGLVIDDFGRGETSLAVLRDLGLAGIKIDRSLIPADKDLQGWRFIEATVALLATLTDKIVAEGIETTAQSRRMHDLGVATQQGYLFGRPAPGQYWLDYPVRFPE